MSIDAHAPESYEQRSSPGARASIAAIAVLAFVLAGCAQTLQSMRSMQDAVFGEPETSTASAAPLLYYVGSDGVPLYRAPGSDVIARLPRHQKVYRTKLSHGYAFVRVGDGGQEGWVDNATLIWRLPKDGAQRSRDADAGPASAERDRDGSAAPEAGPAVAAPTAQDAPPAPGNETAGAPGEPDGSPAVVPASASPATGSAPAAGRINPAGGP